MHAAYIFYVIDQNEPSRPEPVELHPGRLREELLAILNGADEEERIQPVSIEAEKGAYYGDVRLEDPDYGQIVLVSFGDEDRAAAFEELGLSLKDLEREP